VHERIEMTDGYDDPIFEVHLPRIIIDPRRTGHRCRRPARRDMNPPPRLPKLIRLLPIAGGKDNEREKAGEQAKPHRRYCRAAAGLNNRGWVAASCLGLALHTFDLSF
jgi:hypothetical protein